MPNLKTQYLGLELSSPVIVGSGPLTTTPDKVKRLEAVGAGAVVIKSVFEEQIRKDVSSVYDSLADSSDGVAYEYLQADLPMQLGPEKYLKRLEAIKKAVDIPVIASINCIEADQWLTFARKVESTGVDAIELNVYDIPDDPSQTAEDLESRHVELVAGVKELVTLPIAVKLSPFYSALISFANRLETAGAGALVIFNRFLQPDIDIEKISLQAAVNLSRPDDIRLPLRWTAILRSAVKCDISMTGGVHDGEGAIKAILAGANTVQMCSALMQQGEPFLTTVNETMTTWMSRKGFESLNELRGRLKENDLSDHVGFERAQYVNALTGIGGF